MYFEKFPKTLYSLDDRKSLQLVTSIFIRVTLSEEIRNNLSVFDEYDIRDGETPEIVADIFYGNPQLHWVILHANEILDPRFDWPLSTVNFRKYIQSKYSNADVIHHYEDNSGNRVNGKLYLNSPSRFTNFASGDVLTNTTSSGTAVILEKQSESNVTVMVSVGGIRAGDVIYKTSNSAVTASITSTTSIQGTAVTAYEYENILNERKRRIKIIKPQYVDSIIKEFNQKIERING